ncbi:MAG: TetR family transcriptional regulator C-terminal domain-containing protein [Lachnospiraceae bacterium]|nr:TetR family transcriptional regulator C-terminal domain-containing protein [Lachnospiraceae bacterium]
MAAKVDRRVRKTRAQLRAGLARLMQKKNIREITVTELVDEVDINRSTFYLHYEDIYQMLESIEQEIMEEIRLSITSNPIEPLTSTDKAQSFLVHIFTYLEENREICKALLGPHGDMAFVEQTEKLVAETVFESLTNQFPKTTPDLLYTYSFCLTGLVGMLKSWLSAESPESPQYMADLTHKLFTNITRDFYTE